ncbi:SDR family oxidoreductase [Sporosarcina sp. Marseille-Q4063]|uniref:SDR family oxidoreductase n=1 Tax=Sporosarcina sp. Marseille-Q4063 TaxID=2810514 RepID=UPI001BB00FD1|nr:SDR family oxidoreductase [Sporosarcina sp. Marseille-Q4063]QUW21353.1 SDR family oxidoreductase [Sporosarcina sp. Marseille-Q4063]
MNLFDLTDKKAIVTGAASGLGKGMAEGLMEAGAEVVILDLSPNTPKVVDELREKGFKAHGIVANLGDREELQSAFDNAIKLLGGTLDILIPAAGIQRRHKSEDFPIEDWNAVMHVNLNIVFEINQLAGKLMLNQGKGKIINIASMLSYFGGYTVPAYAASKGAVMQMTKALSNEWAGRGVNVNAVAPGYMDTVMNVNIINDSERNESITKRIPAGRWGTSEDMKGVTIFLSSDASNYLNGAIIPVDGGYLGM